MEPQKWKIEWSDELKTGFDDIDDMHKKLIYYAELLYEYCGNYSGNKNELITIIEEAEKCFLEHFDAEESIFEKYQLKDCHHHKELHNQIRKTLKDFENGSNSVIIRAITLNQIIVNYLIKHLFKEDKKIISELREKRTSFD